MFDFVDLFEFVASGSVDQDQDPHQTKRIQNTEKNRNNGATRNAENSKKKKAKNCNFFPKLNKMKDMAINKNGQFVLKASANGVK